MAEGAENQNLSDSIVEQSKAQAVKQVQKAMEPPKHVANVAEDGYDEHWPPDRARLGMFLHSQSFDITRGAVIMLNILLLVFETDEEAGGGKAPTWITTLNYILIVLYLVELIVRIGVYRHQFFHLWANWVDMAIICTDVVIESLLLLASTMDYFPSLVILRTFRLMRLGRTHKALLAFPELNILVLGMRGALKTIFWGMILSAIVVTTFGILAVRLIHPLNMKIAESGGYDDCERCPRAFESVFASSLTFTQQIIAGDSWGTVSVPIIEQYPASFMFFLLVLAIVGMVLVNLILAVVIDSAQQARHETDHQQAELKEKKFQEATAKLLGFCEGLDTDQGGSLSLDELVSGFENNSDFADAMELLDISQKDMSTVFSIMDEDRSGEVKYDEFVEELYKMKSEDSHTMITFIKFYVQEIQREMRTELQNTRQLMAEFHESLKIVISNTTKTLEMECGESPVREKSQFTDFAYDGAAAVQQAKNITSDVLPPQEKAKSQVISEVLPPQKDKSQVTPEVLPVRLDFAWLQRSHQDLKRLLQDVARDVQRNTSVSDSLDQSSLPAAPPRFSLEQKANNEQADEVNQRLQSLADAVSQLMAQKGQVFESVRDRDRTVAEDADQTDASGRYSANSSFEPRVAALSTTAALAVRPPLPVSNSKGMLGCCDASASSAQPPVRIL